MATYVPRKKAKVVQTQYFPSNALMKKGAKGDEGTPIEIRNSNDYIQYKHTTASAWVNIIATTDLVGPGGGDVDMRASSGYIEYKNASETVWYSIIAISDIVTAHTHTDGSIYFENAGGLAWSSSGTGFTTSISASIVTSYLSSVFANRTHSHGSLLLTLQNLSGSYSSNSTGLTVSLTAATGAGGGIALAGSGTYTQDSGTVTFQNSNGLSFGLQTNGVMTGSHNAYSDSSQLTATFQLLGNSTAYNTSVLSTGLMPLAYSSGFQTATLSNTFALTSHTHIYAGTGTTTGSTIGSDIKVTLNSAGLNMSIPAFLTTVFDTTHTHGTLTTASVSGSDITYSSASDGITLGIPAFITDTQSVQTFDTSVIQISELSSSVHSDGIPYGLSLTHLGPVDISASGNTSGTITNITSGTLVLKAGDNLTLSQNGNTLELIGEGSASFNAIQGIAVRDLNGSDYNTFTNGTVVLSEMTNVNIITYDDGTHNFLRFSVGDFAGTTTAGTNIGMTVNSDGIRLSVDTAGMSSFGDGANFIAVSNVTAASLGTVIMSNANNISFGLSTAPGNSNSTLTASYSQSVQTQGMVSLNGSTGNLSIAVSSSLSSSVDGSTISIGLASDISTAWSNMAANASWELEGTKTAGTTSSSFDRLYLEGYNNITLSGSGNTIRFSVADAAGQTSEPRVVSLNGSSGSMSLIASSSLSASSDASNITFGLASNITTALQPAGAYLTTAAESDHSHGNISLSLSNMSGTYSSASNGLTLSMTANAGGGLGGNWELTGNTAGTTSSAFDTLFLQGGNNVTLSGSSNSIVFSVADFAASSHTHADGSIYFNDGGGLTWGSSSAGSTTTISASIVTSYLTSAFANTEHSHGTISLSLSNLSGTYSSASDGLTLSLTGNTGGTAAGGGNWELEGSATAGTTATSFETMFLEGYNNITLSGNSNTIRLSIADFAATDHTHSDGSVYFMDASGISWSSSTNGSSTSFTASVVTSYLSASFAELAHTHGSLSLALSNLTGTYSSGSDGMTLSLSYTGGVGGEGGNWELEGTKTAGTTSASFDTLYLEGYNNITLSGSGNTIRLSVADAAGQSYQPLALSGSNTSTAVNTITFGDLNGITHYITNGSLVASYESDNYVNTSDTGNAYFVNSNGITFGSSVSNLSTSITASYGSNSFLHTSQSGSVYFQDGNGLTFGSSTSSNSTSITGDYAAVRNINLSGNTLGTLTTISSGTLTLAGGNYITLSQNGNAITIQGEAGGGTGGVGIGTVTAVTGAAMTGNTDGLSIAITGFAGLATTYIAGGSATINSSQISLSIPQGTVHFVDSNGVTFGSSQDGVSTTITASVNTVGGGGGFALKGSGTYTQNTGTIEFANSNGLTWGLTNNSMTGSFDSTRYVGLATTYIAGGSATINSSQLSLSIPQGTVHFVDSNGVSFGSSQDGVSTTITASVNTIGGGGIALQGSGTYSQSSGTVQFSNSNNVTFGLSSNGIMTAEISQTIGSLYFTDSNNVSFSASSSSISTTIQAMFSQGYYLSGNTAGTTSFSTGPNITLAGGAGIILSGSNDGNISIVGSEGSIYLNDASGISWSSSTNGASTSFTASVVTSYLTNSLAPIVRVSDYHDPDGGVFAIGAVGQGSLSIKKVFIPYHVTGTAFKLALGLVAATHTSATTASANLSVYYGIYTMNGSTLSMASSGSAANNFAWSMSASTTANTSVNGLRFITGAMNVNASPGNYWIAAVVSSASTFTDCDVSIYGLSTYGYGSIGVIGSNASISMLVPFQGIYTAATAGIPSSIGRAAINYTGSYINSAGFYNGICASTY